jgi:serine/threonine-protein kinase RsbW
VPEEQTKLRDDGVETAAGGRDLMLALRLPAQADEVTRARREIRGLAERAGLTPARCADVALAVGEICSNVVVHAYRDRAPGSFVMRARGRGGELEVVVADQGCGLAPRGDSPGAGYGLPLVAAIASALELRAAAGGGTEVRMLFTA